MEIVDLGIDKTRGLTIGEAVSQMVPVVSGIGTFAAACHTLPGTKIVSNIQAFLLANTNLTGEVSRDAIAQVLALPIAAAAVLLNAIIVAVIWEVAVRIKQKVRKKSIDTVDKEEYE